MLVIALLLPPACHLCPLGADQLDGAFCDVCMLCCRASVPFALLNASVAVSQAVAAPLAAALLQLDGMAGLSGWQ